MMSSSRSAAAAAGQPLVLTTIERRDVGRNDIVIETQCAGICHSDIHTVNHDWDRSRHPSCPS